MKKKSQEPKPEPLRLYIDYTEHSSGGEAEDDGPWAHHADKNISVTFNGIYRTSPIHKFFYHSVEVSEEIHKAKTVYLCIVRYRDGGTFGHTNGHWHVVGVTTGPKEALELIEQALKGDGYKPWAGYFSSLEETEIHDFVVRD